MTHCGINGCDVLMERREEPDTRDCLFIILPRRTRDTGKSRTTYAARQVATLCARLLCPAGQKSLWTDGSGPAHISFAKLYANNQLWRCPHRVSGHKIKKIELRKNSM